MKRISQAWRQTSDLNNHDNPKRRPPPRDGRGSINEYKAQRKHLSTDQALALLDGYSFNSTFDNENQSDDDLVSAALNFESDNPPSSHQHGKKKENGSDVGRQIPLSPSRLRGNTTSKASVQTTNYVGENRAVENTHEANARNFRVPYGRVNVAENCDSKNNENAHSFTKKSTKKAHERKDREVNKTTKNDLMNEPVATREFAHPSGLKYGSPLVAQERRSEPKNSPAVAFDTQIQTGSRNVFGRLCRRDVSESPAGPFRSPLQMSTPAENGGKERLAAANRRNPRLNINQVEQNNGGTPNRTSSFQTRKSARKLETGSPNLKASNNLTKEHLVECQTPSREMNAVDHRVLPEKNSISKSSMVTKSPGLKSTKHGVSAEAFEKVSPKPLTSENESPGLKSTTHGLSAEADEKVSLKPLTSAAKSSLSLSAWGLPPDVEHRYKLAGIENMFPWQIECLCSPGVLEGGNLVYSAPTSAGKTLVAEILLLKRIVETKRKAIVILPFVSVAREKAINLQHLFDPVGIKVEGFMGGRNPAGGFAAVDVAICTIEKANSLINRLLNEGEIHKLGTVIVDELHMVGDEHRGYLLELLLTKIRYMTSRSTSTTGNQLSNSPGEDNSDTPPEVASVQIIGMSATLPNLDMLGRWLNATVYVTDFRPIPLTESVKIGSGIYNNNLVKIRDVPPNMHGMSGDEGHVMSLCLETLETGRSVLIFCPTKNWCEKLALSLACSLYNTFKALQQSAGNDPERKGGLPLGLALNKQSIRDVIEQLKRTPVGLDKMLSQAIPFGVAFHHAGLTFDERDIVESAFRQGTLRILIATSTLSSGVNLPARRVIIRTPIFHGKIIDTRTYKQMIGRAGRKGVDTEGDSVLMCKENERSKAQVLLSSKLPPVHSCLLRHQGGDTVSSSMKRAILEIVVSGVARSPADVLTYASCTMLATDRDMAVNPSEREPGSEACSKELINNCIKFLADSEFIILKKIETEGGESEEQYEATLLGKGVLSSALSPDEGLIVFAELQRARRNFVLENELHIIYQVTPIYQVCTTIDWYHFLCLLDGLSPGAHRVAECVGVSENYLARCVQGRVSSTTPAQQRALAIHRRFYTALVLQELVQETPLPIVADKYRVPRGVLQSLQQAAATFAGMVTAFCSGLGWNNLELLLAQFQPRLSFGVQRELTDLVRLSLLNARRARCLYNAGFHTVAALANALPAQVEALLRASVPFHSKRGAAEESEWERKEREKVRCISVSGQKGLSESEAAIMIINEARELVEAELGISGIKWNKMPPVSGGAGEGSAETSSGVKIPDILDAASGEPKTRNPSVPTPHRGSTIKAPAISILSKTPRPKDTPGVASHEKGTSREESSKTPSNIETDNTMVKILNEENREGMRQTSASKQNDSVDLSAVNTEEVKTLTTSCADTMGPQTGSKKNDPVKISPHGNQLKHHDKINSELEAGSMAVKTHESRKSDTPKGKNLVRELELDISDELYSEPVTDMNEPIANVPNDDGNYHPRPTKVEKLASKVEGENRKESLNGAAQDTSAELYTEPMEEFDDSFVFDTQLAALVTGTNTDIESSNTCANLNDNRNFEVKKATREEAARESENFNPSLCDQRKEIEIPEIIIDTSPVHDSETEAVGRSEKTTGNSSTAMPCPGMCTKSPSVARSQQPQPKQSNPAFDLSLDDDFELFMDGYSTQKALRETSVTVKPAAAARIYVPTEAVALNEESMLASSFTDSHRFFASNEEADDIAQRLTGTLNAVLPSDFVEPKSPVQSSVLGTRVGRKNSTGEIMKVPTLPVPRGRRSDVSSCDVTQTEELAYASLIHDSSNIPELDDEDDGQENELEKNIDIDIDVSNLDDDISKNESTTTKEMDRGVKLIEVNRHQQPPQKQESATFSDHDLSQYLADIGTSCLNESWSPVPQVPAMNMPLKANDPEKSSTNKTHLSNNDQVNTGAQNNHKKRKSEESLSNVSTPRKQRRVDEQKQDAPPPVENEDMMKSPNTSDCVPPTPPQASAATTPRTQGKKSQFTQRRTRSSAKKSKKSRSGNGTSSGAKGKSSKAESNQATRLASVAEYTDAPLHQPSAETQTPKKTVKKIIFSGNGRVTRSQLDSTKSQQTTKQSLVDHSTVETKICDPHSNNVPNLSQLLPLTNENFSIIDVAANKELFEHFIAEWGQTEKYSLCFACERFTSSQTSEPPKPRIGANFMQQNQPVPVGSVTKRLGSDRGLLVHGTQLRLVGVAVSWANRDAYYISLLEEEEPDDLDDSLSPPPHDPSLSIKHRLQCVTRLLTSRRQGLPGGSSCKVAMFDIKEQVKVMARATGAQIRANVQDPKVAVWLLDPGAKEMSLHGMVQNKLPMDTYMMEGLGGGIGLTSLGLSPDNPGSARVRACIEAVVVGRLMSSLEEDLNKENLFKAFSEVEMPTQLILAHMELNGFGFSEDECERQKAMMVARIEALEETAYSLAGRPFSLSSPEDVSQVLFIDLKLPPSGDPLNPMSNCKTLGPARGRRVKRVPFSTSKDVLEKLRGLHPLPGLVLEWRRISMAMTKVVFPLTKEKVYSEALKMSRIFSVSQTHTATGRVSMADPNLQNIPNDFEINVMDPNNRGLIPESTFAVSMRHAFVPYTGGVILAADYSQLELRIIAHLSGDQRLKAILNEDRDVFKLIAAEWKGLEVSQVTSEHRKQAKQVCYGMLYGIGAKALSEQLSVPEEEASVFMETFKDKYKGLKAFLRSCVTKCRDRGYVETMYNRRRYLPAIRDNNSHAKAHAERQAVNTTVQGSAADLVKLAMTRIEQNLAANFTNALSFHNHQRLCAGVGAPPGSRGKPSVPPRAYLLLQLHDELIYEVNADVLHQVAYLVKETMETAMTLDVRLPVKVKCGPSWGRLTDMDL